MRAEPTPSAQALLPNSSSESFIKRGSQSAAKEPQQPVHVTISIIERHACQSWCLHLHGTISNFTCGILISLHPRVEDPDVVVGSDEGDQARDEHSTLVLGLHCK